MEGEEGMLEVEPESEGWYGLDAKGEELQTAQFILMVKNTCSVSLSNSLKVLT